MTKLGETFDGNMTGYVPDMDRKFLSTPFAGNEWDKKVWERSEWDKEADRQIELGIDPLSRIVRAKCMPVYQDGLPSCWAQATAMAAKGAYAGGGQPIPQLSATCIAAKLQNYRINGGNAYMSFPFAAEHGIPTINTWPENQVNKSLDTPEMREEAAKFKAVEWYELKPNNAAQLVSALLAGFTVWTGYARKGHAMCAVRYQNGKIWNLNSWNQNAPSASEWDLGWFDDRNTIWKIDVDETCFEQYGLRVVTTFA